MSAAPIQTALVGAGHLGCFHAEKLAQLPEAVLAAVVDTDPAQAGRVAAEFGGQPHTTLAPVLHLVDAVVIAAPTVSHFEIARAALEAGCHVFVEKPMTRTVQEGEELLALAATSGRKLQVGHVERFNPIFQAARARIGVPAFVEAERLAPFIPRSMDVDVVLDLMIHDLDLLLSIVPQELEALEAVGVAVLTGREDIANARLRFANGTVANLTASRVSRDKVRKMRIFGPRGYLSLDLLTREGRHAAVGPHPEGEIEVPGMGRFRVGEESLRAEPIDAIRAELAAFFTAIREDREPEVSGTQALRVIRIAASIQAEVRRSLQRFEHSNR